MYMNCTMSLPGLEEVTITKTEMIEGCYHIHIECKRIPHTCPNCGIQTKQIHDYRIQKIHHLKLFERQSVLFYRKRRYRCQCGKRFYEGNCFVQRFQRHSVEWNKALHLRMVKGKTFKETAILFFTSSSTVMRRFDALAKHKLQEVEELPRVIAIDEYKGDTDKGKYQLIIADGETHQPIDILPNRSKKTIEQYLRKKGSKVEIVSMDMSYAFKSAIEKVLDKPVIVADRFHFSRYVYWALDKVRRRVQSNFSDYDRKKGKRIRHLFYKASDKITSEDQWILDRYFTLSEELKRAYDLKEAYRSWFQLSKENGATQPEMMKQRLVEWYSQVENENIPEFKEVIKTFRNWQTEILNSFIFGYSNGFLEGINNQTKVIKRNGFGFRRFDRLRSRVLLHHQFKHISIHIG